jgi:hypothetical protein
VSDPPEAGWHPDPQRRYEFRYFNGERWTTDVAADGRRFVDPGGPAGWQATPVDARRRPPGRGQAIAAFVVSLCSLAVAWAPFVVVVAAAGAVTAVVLGVIALRRGRGVPDSGRGLAIAGIAVAPFALALCTVGVLLTAAVVREVDDFLNPGRYELVADLPCNVDGDTVRFTGSIRNLDDRQHDYRITIEILRGVRVVHRSNVPVVGVAPDATVRWGAEATVRAEPASSASVTCRVGDVRGPSPFGIDTA